MDREIVIVAFRAKPGQVERLTRDWPERFDVDFLGMSSMGEALRLLAALPSLSVSPG